MLKKRGLKLRQLNAPDKKLKRMLVVSVKRPMKQHA